MATQNGKLIAAAQVKYVTDGKVADCSKLRHAKATKNIGARNFERVTVVVVSNGTRWEWGGGEYPTIHMFRSA